VRRLGPSHRTTAVALVSQVRDREIAKSPRSVHISLSVCMVQCQAIDTLCDEEAMTIGPDLAGAVTAFNRFGLGARPGDLAAAAGDPRGFLLEELWTANAALVRDRPPPSGPAALQAYYLEQQQKRTERKMMAAAAAGPPAQAPPGPEPREGASMAAVSAGQSETPQRPKPGSHRLTLGPGPGCRDPKSGHTGKRAKSGNRSEKAPKKTHSEGDIGATHRRIS
jgi:hypothetical protein